jgi:hypothetical protein
MVSQKKYNQLLPENLLPWLKEVEQNPPKIIGFRISRLEYIISLILTHKQKKYPGSYSLLTMEYIKNIIVRADEYINFLRDSNIIEWVSHSSGRNSRMYRVTKQYDGPVVWRPITDMNIIRRIEENRRSLKFRNSKKYPVLNKYVYMIEIDYEAALKTIEEEHYIRSQSKDAEISLKADNRRTYSLGEIFKIRNKEIYIKVNKTNFRYDTNYTRLPSELVKHLLINGNPLREFDIVNSQPFFVNSFISPSPEIERIMGYLLTIYNKSLNLIEKQDVKHYRSLTSEGIFYEFMMREFTRIGIEYSCRQDFKDKLFTVFFGSNGIHTPAVKLFAEKFPAIENLFRYIKKDDNANLPNLLTRIESFIMLDCVAPRIIKEFPEVPFLTKHDCVLPVGIMITDRVEEIKALISDEIKKLIGISPKFKDKNLCFGSTSIYPISYSFSPPNPSPPPLLITNPCNKLIFSKNRKVGLKKNKKLWKIKL